MPFIWSTPQPELCCGAHRTKPPPNLRLTSMTSGIVGNIVAVDDNSDGYVDLLYAADLGGRIWRIDFDNSQSNANYYAKGGLIADLGGE